MDKIKQEKDWARDFPSLTGKEVISMNHNRLKSVSCYLKDIQENCLDKAKVREVIASIKKLYQGKKWEDGVNSFVFYLEKELNL